MASRPTRDRTTQHWTSSRWQRPFVRSSFLIGALSLLVFVGLALTVLLKLPLLRLDARVALVIWEHTSSKGTRAMRLISALAVPGVPLIGIAGTALLAARRRWADLALWMAALGGGLALNLTIKQLFDSIRPTWADPLRFGHQWQFPSGHVLGATICYGLIVLLCWRKIGRRPARIALLLGLVGLLLLIGFSRVYIRSHYLGDVLAGYAIGLSWLAICVGVWAAYRPARGVLQ